MLRQIAERVHVHQSSFMQSNALVVQGSTGALVIDAGITTDEIACLAADLRELGQPVVAGFSTHPHWDHMLWHPGLGEAPRYAGNRCATTARERLSAPGAKDRLASVIPPDLSGQVPLDLLGQLTVLPPDSTHVPWDGPAIRLIEHNAHAPGHTALVIEEARVLVAGDMLSDILIPILDLGSSSDPVQDYLDALELLEAEAGNIDILVPGHGSVARSNQVAARIELDRAYLRTLHDGGAFDDPRGGPSPDIHDRQLKQLAGRN
jgi:glyoxylase-like metal-dependent hydrolase (beta-lactamase superfamily II)